MDAVTAFLQGGLKEEIYMLQPKGFRIVLYNCMTGGLVSNKQQSSKYFKLKLSENLKMLLAGGLRFFQIVVDIHHKIGQFKCLCGVNDFFGHGTSGTFIVYI